MSNKVLQNSQRKEWVIKKGKQKSAANQTVREIASKHGVELKGNPLLDHW